MQAIRRTDRSIPNNSEVECEETHLLMNFRILAEHSRGGCATSIRSSRSFEFIVGLHPAC